ncbi:hypothetical protein NCS56_00805000 [Fusarium sp. Ph1]|nr:hypothetical protein NCS56_00805000 [Fusarium sp. Ph1]
MEESSERPESKDRGRTPSSGIQQQIGRGRSPVRPRARPPRSKPTETTVPSILSKTRDVMGDPGSDIDNDTTPTDNDDSDSEDSERDHNEKKGNRKGESDSTKRKEDDKTQYDEFQKMQPFTNQASFPVSENSIECDIFNRSLQDLVACLRRSNTGWVSIDCPGRIWVSESKERKIRTTVVASFSQYPDRAEELRRDLQMVMKDNDLPVEFIQGRVTRAGIHKILTRLGPPKPLPKGMYGDDRKTYLCDFVRQALDYWNMRHPDNRIGRQRRDGIVLSIDGKLLNLNVPDQRTHHRRTYWSAITGNGLEDSETHIMEDMRWFLKLHYYELQIALEVIRPLHELNGRGIALFKDFVRIRRLRRERPKLSRIIEHPAKVDSESVIDSLQKLVPPSGEGPPMPQEDVGQLRQKLQRRKEYMRSADRLVGTVWASSGLGGLPRRQGSPPPKVEDWALIKLFRENSQEVQNKFSANPLRPGFPEQRLSGVRELSDPVRIDATKRGRTTDLTVGIANGAPSVINEGGELQRTFTIVAPHMAQFFSASGDSGSWIMDRTGQLVGMMWGDRKRFLSATKNVVSGDLAGYTSQDLEVEDVTYFTPASYLFKRIENSFKEWRNAWEGDLPEHFDGRVRLFGSD